MSEASPRIPLLVLGGFLGAGKTTLLNHLLSQRDAQGQGLRWLAMVNDFGEINLDAELIAQRHADTVALTNGCVCCSIGDDLSQALMQALDRRPLPEAIVIEASGVSDPWRVAQLGMAAREIMLDGVVVVIDAASALAHAADPMLTDTLTRPLAHADLVIINKTDLAKPEQRQALDLWLDHHAPQARRWPTVDAQVPLALLSSAALHAPTCAPTEPHHVQCACHAAHAAPVETPETSAHATTSTSAQHPVRTEPVAAHVHDHSHHHDQQFVTWHAEPQHVFNEAELRAHIHALPRAILRIKGVVQTELGWRELQFAGTKLRFRSVQAPSAAQLIAIGLRSATTTDPFVGLLQTA